jgi:hypothetical protein
MRRRDILNEVFEKKPANKVTAKTFDKKFIMASKNKGKASIISSKTNIEAVGIKLKVPEMIGESDPAPKKMTDE